MFGFLYAPAPSCGTTARSLYQSVFCGLSCQLHADYHATARFLVNRDSTFLALAGAALADEDTPMQERSCCNPLARHKPVCSQQSSLSYAAAVTVSGLATKLKDNDDDERGWRRHLPRLASNILTPARDNATAVLNSSGFPTQKVIDTLQRQTEIEQGGAGFMEASEPTAQSYGLIFSHLAEINRQSQSAPSLFQLGSSLGRLIYWKDAVDDWGADQRRGRFNPLRHQSAEELPSLVSKEFQLLLSATTIIPWLRHRPLIESVITHTTHHHQELAAPPGSTQKKPSKKNESKKDPWCEWFDCSSSCDCSCGGCDSCGCDCCSCS